MIYCIDTSALIAAWNERYPIRHVPPFWESLDSLIQAGRLVSPVEVRHEIKKKADGLHDWVKLRKEMFLELEHDVQHAAREILESFPYLVKEVAGRKSADPFVIALAKARGLTVVTEEGVGSDKRPRIPLVCQRLDLRCFNLLGMIQAEDWII